MLPLRCFMAEGSMRRMKTPRIILPLLLAACLALAGCATAPRLSLESSVTRGKERQVFYPAEKPAIYVGASDRYNAALKIVARPSGQTVWRMALADFYGRDPDAVTYVDETGGASLETAQKRVPAPRLPPGLYDVELWIKGARVSTSVLTVTAPTQWSPTPMATLMELQPRPPDELWVRVPPGRQPTSADRQALLKDLVGRDAAALDAVVGLTTDQRRQAQKIYSDANSAMAATTSSELRPPHANEIRKQTDAQIRALLTPVQLKLYEDDGSAYREQLAAKLPPQRREQMEIYGPGYDPGEMPPDVLARTVAGKVQQLDRVVHLTESQKAECAKIFAAQDRAVTAYLSMDVLELVRATDPIRQQARAQIRALLTPDQRKIYDATPQRRGGGSTHDGSQRPELLD
jgi:hypothetical protein